jgi:hypothetical protein
VSTGNERRARGTKRVGTWTTLDGTEWDALPVGHLREVEVAPGVRLVVERVNAQEWRVLTRGGLPTAWLTGFRSVERVRRPRRRRQGEGDSVEAA